MAGGDPEDVYRSLRRYVSLMLGSPPWTVRLQRSRVSDDERPVAVLEPGLLGTASSRAGMVNQGDVQKAQPFTVVCYPALGATAALSAQIARELVVLLDAGFSRGLVTDDDPPVNIGAPWRTPVYDFAGVEIAGADRAGGGVAYMHANVAEGMSARAIQDPQDELRYTVVANLRLTWWAGGRIPPAAPLATDGLIGEWDAVHP